MKFFLFSSACFSIAALGQSFTVSTIAGTGHFTGDGGKAIAAQLYLPSSLAVSQAGEVYIADSGNHRIRVVDTSGNIRTVAGDGSSANNGDGKLATDAATGKPNVMVFDSAGNLYFTAQNQVREVDTAGIVTTVAGKPSLPYTGFTNCTSAGDGAAALDATICNLEGLARDSRGTLYIADGSRIRSFTPGGSISTIAGSDNTGDTGDGGPAASATLSRFITGLAVDSADNLYIADSGNGSIRKIDGNRVINAVPVPAGLAFGLGLIGFDHNGALYYADPTGNIEKLVNGVGSIVATVPDGIGLPVAGFAFDSQGKLYLCDGVAQVTKFSAGVASLFAGSIPAVSAGGGRATDASLNLSLSNLAADNAGDVFFFENTNFPAAAARLDKVTTDGTLVVLLSSSTVPPTSDGSIIPLISGEIAVDPTGQQVYFTQGPEIFLYSGGAVTRYAGKVHAGFADMGDGAQALDAVIGNDIAGLTLDRQGNLYVAETAGNLLTSENAVRKIDTNGIIRLYAGSESAGGFMDGPVPIGKLLVPQGMAADSAGDLYIADYSNHRLREVTQANQALKTVAGNGTQGYSTDGVPATSSAMTGPNGVAIGPAGQVFFSSGESHLAPFVIIEGIVGENRVHTIGTSGDMVTIAGSGIGSSDYGDGLPATQAEFNEPQDVAADSHGNLYVLDYLSNKIRKLTPVPPAVTSVVNADSAQLSAGMLAVVSGSNFGPNAADIKVTVGGKAAYVYPNPAVTTQFVIEIPTEAGAGPTTLVASVNGYQSAPFNFTLASYAPAVITQDPTNSGLAGVYLASTNKLVTLQFPAHPGDALYTYAVGLGPTAPPTPTGVPATSNPTSTTPVVTLGGIAATGVSAVMTQAGVYKVSFTAPASVQGTVPVVVSIGGAQSSGKVTIAFAGLSSVVNNGSFANPGVVSPGSIATAFANGLGTSTDHLAGVYPSTTSEGVQLTFGGHAAPMFHLVASTAQQQVDLLVPPELPTSGTVNVQLATSAGTYPNYTLNMAPSNPGFYRIPDPLVSTRFNIIAQFANTIWLVLPAPTATALGLPACSTGTSALSACGQPAAIGDFLVMYATGLGLTTPNGAPGGTPLASGQSPPADGSVLYETPTTPVVTVGGIQATVLYSGLAPGFAGLYQIDIQVPPGVASGDDVPVKVTILGASDTATISVHPR